MNKKGIVASIDHWGMIEPERIAYQTPTEQYAFKQLKQFSDALASYLDKRLTNQGPIVVFGNLEFEMIVAFLGATKSGHAYLPIEEHTPIERIETIIKVAQPAMVISIGQWSLETDIPVMSKDCLRSITTSMVGYVPLNPVKKEETFYIIFTSGTTGEPKGVQISHDNLVSFVQWTKTEFQFEEDMRFLAQAPFSFDLSVFSIYPALVYGGMLKPLEKSVVQDFRQLIARLDHFQLDVWISTPSFIDICLMEPSFDEHLIPELSMFIFCGEELTKKTAQELLKRFPSAKIYNTYGPTEATVAVSSLMITPEILAQYERLPIGYVKEDTNVWIAKDEEQESGEIIICGPSVSQGYLNNPKKTNEAFFKKDDQRSYRTGDVGRFAENRLLFIEGRMDQQIKLQGYRIELGDVEHGLLKDERVKQAVVVPKYNGTKVQQLVAFIVLETNTKEHGFALTRSLKKQMAQFVMDYMIPKKFVYVDHLPQTVNGKLDRKALTAEVNET